MASPVLLYEMKDEIAYITMNRPEKLNAVNGELSDALRETWERIEKAGSNRPECSLSGSSRLSSKRHIVIQTAHCGCAWICAWYRLRPGNQGQ